MLIHAMGSVYVIYKVGFIWFSTEMSICLYIKNIFIYDTGCNNYIVLQKGTTYFNLIIES